MGMGVAAAIAIRLVGLGIGIGLSVGLQRRRLRACRHLFHRLFLRRFHLLRPFFRVQVRCRRRRRRRRCRSGFLILHWMVLPFEVFPRLVTTENERHADDDYDPNTTTSDFSSPRAATASQRWAATPSRYPVAAHFAAASSKIDRVGSIEPLLGPRPFPRLPKRVVIERADSLSATKPRHDDAREIQHLRHLRRQRTVAAGELARLCEALHPPEHFHRRPRVMQQLRERHVRCRRLTDGFTGRSQVRFQLRRQLVPQNCAHLLRPPRSRDTVSQHLRQPGKIADVELGVAQSTSLAPRDGYEASRLTLRRGPTRRANL